MAFRAAFGVIVALACSSAWAIDPDTPYANDLEHSATINNHEGRITQLEQGGGGGGSGAGYFHIPTLVGDGVADDAPALQAAINSYPAVAIPSGSYRLGSEIVVSAKRHILIAPGAELLLAPNASLPSGRVDLQNANYYCGVFWFTAGASGSLIDGNGHIDAQIELQGNDATGHKRTPCAMVFDRCTDMTIRGGLRVSRCNAGLFAVDADRSDISGMWGNNPGNAPGVGDPGQRGTAIIAMEGCYGGTVRDIAAFGSWNEVIDLNAYCRNILIDGVTGENLYQEAIDINGGRGNTVRNVRLIDSRIFFLNSNPGTRLTTRTFGIRSDNTISGVRALYSGSWSQSSARLIEISGTQTGVHCLDVIVVHDGPTSATNLVYSSNNLSYSTFDLMVRTPTAYLGGATSFQTNTGTVVNVRNYGAN